MAIAALPGSLSGMGLKFEGLAADQNILDAIDYSKALDGSSRLYKLVAHYCLHGDILKPRTRSDLRCYTLPSKSGSYESLLVILPVIAQDIPVFADVYKTSLDWLISTIMGFIKDKLAGQGDMNELISAIKERAEASEELNTLLTNGLLKSNDHLATLHEKLIDTIPSLVCAAEPNMRKAVTAVGSSCNKMTAFHELNVPVVVTEPEAEAIRSGGDLKVGSQEVFQIVRLHSLHLDTGSCTIELEGYDGLFNGKVTDIALAEPGNPYSSALNEHASLQVRARPVYKEDALHKLYITEPTQ